MIKFGKAEKIRCFDFLFQIVQFYQFQTQIEEGAKIKDLNIHRSLSMEKEARH
jgi:hypothetical protein